MARDKEQWTMIHVKKTTKKRIKDKKKADKQKNFDAVINTALDKEEEK